MTAGEEDRSAEEGKEGEIDRRTGDEAASVMVRAFTDHLQSPI